jgi:hypothetical protein
MTGRLAFERRVAVQHEAEVDWGEAEMWSVQSGKYDVRLYEANAIGMRQSRALTRRIPWLPDVVKRRNMASQTRLLIAK